MNNMNTRANIFDKLLIVIKINSSGERYEKEQTTL